MIRIAAMPMAAALSSPHLNSPGAVARREDAKPPCRPTSGNLRHRSPQAGSAFYRSVSLDSYRDQLVLS